MDSTAPLSTSVAPSRWLRLALLAAALAPGLAFAQQPPPRSLAPAAAAQQPVPGESVYTEESLTRLLLYDTPELRAEVHGFVNLEYQAKLAQAIADGVKVFLTQINGRDGKTP